MRASRCRIFIASRVSRVCVCDSHRRLFIMLLLATRNCLMTASTHTTNRAHAAESATSVATAIIIIIISQIHITMQAHKRPLAAHEVKPTQDQFIVAVNMKTEKKQKYCLLLLRQRRKAKLFWNVFFFFFHIRFARAVLFAEAPNEGTTTSIDIAIISCVCAAVNERNSSSSSSCWLRMHDKICAWILFVFRSVQCKCSAKRA